MTLPSTMKAMVTMGHGDLDQMVLHEDWPRPEPAAGEVLIRVGACGLNNTDVNTRSGWYSKTVTDATTGGAFDEVGGDWSGDIDRIKAGVALLESGETAMADANQGWRVDNAAHVARANRDLDFILEQPCKTYEECQQVRRVAAWPSSP